MRERALMDFGDVGQAGAIYLYSDDWRLFGRVDLDPAAISVGGSFSHDGTDFEVFDINDLGAFAAPPALLPRRIDWPWRRTAIADRIEETLNEADADVWRESLDEFDDWFEDFDMYLPNGAHEAVGSSLLNEREADAVQQFLDRLNAIYSEIGDVPFGEYEAHPGWSAVKTAAGEVLVALGRSA